MKREKRKAVSVKSKAAAAALPAYLLGVEELLPSYAGVIAVNQSDGGHAGLNAMPALKALCKPLKIPVTVKPVMQSGEAQILGVLYEGLIDGLTINKCSLAAGGTESLLSLQRVDNDKLFRAYFSLTRPVLNIVPSGATKPPKPPISDCGITVLGMSASVIPWAWLATVAAVSIKPDMRQQLAGYGTICPRLKRLLAIHVAPPDADGYFPDILKWKPAKLEDAARNVASAANSL